MSLEQMSSHIDEWPSLKDSPEYQKQLNERVKQVEQDEKNYKHLVKVNDVLSVLDVEEEQEKVFRKTLDTLDSQTLKDLATKTRLEILGILTSKKLQEWNSTLKQNDDLKSKESTKQNIETEKQSIEYQETDKKYQKIKNILPDWIYNWDAKFDNLVKWLNIFEKLQNLPNSNENNNDKIKALEVILNELKNWDVLNSIIKEIGWANPSNPQYQEFKNTLISIDPSFRNIFPELERLHNKTAFPTKEVFDVDWWIVNIDLKDEKITAKEIWSDYAFEDKLDTEALNNISSECSREIKEYKNGFAVLKGAYAPFGELLNQISSWKDISELISNFDISSFNKLESLTSELNLDTNITLSSADIYELQNITDKKQLQLKLESIKQKFIKLANAMEKKEDEIKQKYHNEFAEFLRQKAESKELQIKVLKFFGDIGFDRIAKSKSDVVVDYINRNSWKFGLDSKMDFKNWNIGFNKDFWDKEISSTEKVEFIKLFNRMLWSEVVDENIAYGTSNLSIEAIWEIQRLNNRTVGFFVGNLEKLGNGW